MYYFKIEKNSKKSYKHFPPKLSFNSIYQGNFKKEDNFNINLDIWTHFVAQTKSKNKLHVKT